MSRNIAYPFNVTAFRQDTTPILRTFVIAFTNISIGKNTIKIFLVNITHTSFGQFWRYPYVESKFHKLVNFLLRYFRGFFLPNLIYQKRYLFTIFLTESFIKILY